MEAGGAGLEGEGTTEVIELQMVHRMAKRGVVLAGVVAIVMLVCRKAPSMPSRLWSALALTIGNLWLSATLIGGVAEKNPQLLLPVGLATFALGLMLVTVVSAVLWQTDLIYFPVTGFTLIGLHLVLVLSEASGAYGHARTKDKELLNAG